MKTVLESIGCTSLAQLPSLLFAGAFFAILVFRAEAQSYTFSTLAGLAETWGSTDGVGSAARFASPRGVAVDGAGNVYVADSFNHTIRRVTPSGAVSTLAGLAGSAGSRDGTGSGARFNLPFGVAVDGTGLVYVADTHSHTIRKVTPAGVVTTLAGVAGSFGDTNSGDPRFGRFQLPYGLAVDASGNVFVADYGNNRIRQVGQFGSVDTLAGSRSSGSADGTGSGAQFNAPNGVAVDAAGNVYVADTYNHTVRKVTAGVVTTLAGLAVKPGNIDGTGSAARFSYPASVAVDDAGNLYVADGESHTIRKVTPAGVVTTVAGLAGIAGSADGTGGDARFNSPAGVAVDSAGNLYVADYNNSIIRKGVPTGPPTILTQPQGQIITATTNVTFAVTATGPSVSYLWKKDGIALPNATNSSVTLSNVTRAASGLYTVILNNSFGSITSAPVVLRVLVPQRFSSGPNLHRLPDGRLHLYFRDLDGGLASDLTRFEIHSTSNLRSPGTIWVTNITGSLPSHRN